MAKQEDKSLQETAPKANKLGDLRAQLQAKMNNQIKPHTTIKGHQEQAQEHENKIDIEQTSELKVEQRQEKPQTVLNDSASPTQVIGDKSNIEPNVSIETISQVSIEAKAEEIIISKEVSENKSEDFLEMSVAKVIKKRVGKDIDVRASDKYTNVYVSKEFHAKVKLVCNLENIPIHKWFERLGEAAIAKEYGDAIDKILKTKKK